MKWETVRNVYIHLPCCFSLCIFYIFSIYLSWYSLAILRLSYGNDYCENTNGQEKVTYWWKGVTTIVTIPLEWGDYEKKIAGRQHTNIQMDREETNIQTGT
jgi:hypothetical protein